MQPLLYRALATIGLLALVFCAGWYIGRSGATSSLKAKYESELKASMEQSRAIEQKWQKDFDLNTRNLANVLNTTIADRDRIIARLHNDQNRASVSKDPRTNCPSPTWRTIPAEMGEEVIREVAERDQFREGLKSCYSALDTIQYPR